MASKKINDNGSVMVSGRLSFHDLAKPGRFKNDANAKPRYSIKLLVPKDSEEANLIMEVTEKLMADKFKESDRIKDKSKIPALIKNIRNNPGKCCITDGDDQSYDGYAGHWVISAYRNAPGPRPTCLNAMREKMTDEDDIATTFYSGCYVHAMLDFWVQDSKDFGQGLRCSPAGVMFYKNGDRFGGGRVANTSDFDDVEIEAPDITEDKDIF